MLGLRERVAQPVAREVLPPAPRVSKNEVLGTTRRGRRELRRKKKTSGLLEVGEIVNGRVHSPLTSDERDAYLVSATTVWPPSTTPDYWRKGDPTSKFFGLPHLTPLTTNDLPGLPQKGNGMSRRELLKIGGVLGLATAVKANGIASELLWPPSEAGVYEIEAEVAKRNERSATFVFGGLGIRDSGEEAHSIKGALQEIGRVVAVRYGGNEMDLDTIAEDINRYIAEKGIKEISIYGDSMGGIAGVHTLPNIDLSLNGGVRVKYIFADCTPITKSNVREQNADIAEFLADYTNFKGGGLAGKIAGQLYQHFDHPQDWLNIKEQIEGAWHVALDPNSSGLWIDQLRLVSESTVRSFANRLAQVNYEEMFYIHPWNVRDDVVVYDMGALNDLIKANEIAHGWKRRHHRKVPKVTPIVIPDISHASCVEHPERYTAALKGAIYRSQAAA